METSYPTTTSPSSDRPRRRRGIKKAWSNVKSIFGTPSSQSLSNNGGGVPSASSRSAGDSFKKKRLKKLFRSTSRLKSLVRCSLSPSREAVARQVVEVELIQGNTHALLSMNNTKTNTGAGYCWADFCHLFDTGTNVVWLSRSTFVTTLYMERVLLRHSYKPVLTLETLQSKNNCSASRAFTVISRSVGNCATTFRILLHLLQSNTTATGLRLSGPQRQQGSLNNIRTNNNIRTGGTAGGGVGATTTTTTTTLPVAGSLLADFVHGCSANLSLLALDNFCLAEDHLRLLAGVVIDHHGNSSNTMQVALSHCQAATAARDAFVLFLRHTAAVVTIRNCPNIDAALLAQAVTTVVVGVGVGVGAVVGESSSSRLTRLDLARGQLAQTADYQAFLQAVRWNLGLQELCFSAECRAGGRWAQLLAAVEGHGTLQILDLRRLGALNKAELVGLESLLRTNTTLQVYCSTRPMHQHFYKTVIVQLSEMNELRRRGLQDYPRSRQASVLPHAVAVVSGNPNLVRMLLVQHVEVVCQRQGQQHNVACA